MLNLDPNDSKDAVFQKVEAYLQNLAIKIASKDDSRPWGGFFVIDLSTVESFMNNYFAELNSDEIYKYGKNISPKILLVQPNQPLSWQYHYRRAEVWKIVSGPVGLVTSDDDTQKPVQTLQTGELIKHGPKVRHRLVGLDGWGVVAEIWQHTDPEKLSDEEDIIRLEDNYGRK